jgi:acetolactate synthase-1/2/3 large subunit
VRELLPLDEPANSRAPGYLNPYTFVVELSDLCRPDDVVIPCSSGGAFTVMMQAFAQKQGQLIISDKGLASMGYGLSGSIGAALAHPERRTILLEGDGGFAQNLQELGTVAVNGLNLKMFVLANEGYASIRMTQRNYFGGQYLGCDTATGLGFPAWEGLFEAYGIPVVKLDETGLGSPDVAARLAEPGPAGFVVPIDPEQTYFPKITSRVTETGSMESQPLHLMSPDLPDDVAQQVFVYLDL